MAYLHLRFGTKELFLARDRVGVKPLYYYFDGKNFIFSSEIKAILEHPIKREIETKALGLYFKLRYVPSPLTLFRNIFKLPPAHFMIFMRALGPQKILSRCPI